MFIKLLLTAALLFSLLSGKSKIKIAPDNEPGERMIVSGVVYDEDGKTPLKEVEVYVYHTDAKGYYGDNFKHRLNGTMVTNDKGEYEYNTIRPASYPNQKFAAHVHYKITGKGIPEQWRELQFEGDKLLKAADIEKEKKNGSFSQIQKLVKNKDGILTCRMDIKIKR